MNCQRCCGASDFPLCWSCSKKLRGLLVEVRELIDEIQIEVTRQAKSAPQPGRSPSGWVLPFNAAASDAFDAVRRTLTVWSVCVGADLKFQGMDSVPQAVAAADWLVAHCIDASHHDQAGRLFRDIEQLVERGMRTIGHKQGRTRIGTCPCGRPVQARGDQPLVMCVCGEVYDVAATQARLVREGLAECVVTAVEAVSLGELHDCALKPNTIIKWYQREKLACADAAEGVCDHPGSHRFRFGDILTLGRA